MIKAGYDKEQLKVDFYKAAHLHMSKLHQYHLEILKNNNATYHDKLVNQQSSKILPPSITDQLVTHGVY